MSYDILTQVLQKYSEGNRIELTAKLKDLGIDSINFLMSLMELEDRLQQTINITDLTLDSTVEDVLHLIMMRK